MNEKIELLVTEFFNDMKDEFLTDESFDDLLLKRKIKNAIRDVIKIRRYPSTYTDDYKVDDLYKFYSNIQDIALYDYNKIGAEFQTSHSENSVSRSWQEREKLFYGIVPIADL